MQTMDKIGGKRKGQTDFPFFFSFSVCRTGTTVSQIMSQRARFVCKYITGSEYTVDMECSAPGSQLKRAVMQQIEGNGVGHRFGLFLYKRKRIDPWKSLSDQGFTDGETYALCFMLKLGQWGRPCDRCYGEGKDRESWCRHDEDSTEDPWEALCCVCTENKSCCMFARCGHMVTCQTCAERVDLCCVCRAEILQRINALQ